jgi:hypothetical protein
VRGIEAISTAALLDLIGLPNTTGNGRRIAHSMRSLGFVPIKSRPFMPGRSGRALGTSRSSQRWRFDLNRESSYEKQPPKVGIRRRSKTDSIFRKTLRLGSLVGLIWVPESQVRMWQGI